MPPPQANNIHIVARNKTDATPTEEQQNVHYNGVLVWLHVNSTGGTTPSISVTIQRKDPVSGEWEDVITSTTLSAAGLATVQVHPALTEAANQKASELLGRHWRINPTLDDADGDETYDYDLSYVQVDRF